jgi:hypothetical protein
MIALLTPQLPPSKLAENGRRFASNRVPQKIWTITQLKYRLMDFNYPMENREIWINMD